jgi:uncharacterized protein
MQSRRQWLKVVAWPAGLACSAPLWAQAVPAANPEGLRIVMLLESSVSYQRASAAVQAGARTAHRRDGAGVILEHVAFSGTDPGAQVRELATRGVNVIIGPLTRDAVNALADGGALPTTVLSLNQPDADRKPQSNLVLFGLPIESEARQLARHAFEEVRARAASLEAKALVLHSGAPLSRRAAMSFTETWQAAGGEVVTTVESEARSGAEWRAQALQALNGAAVQVVFAAVPPEVARGLRNGLPREWLLISTSQLNSMATNVAGRAADLEGWRITEMPWQVSPDHPAVMGYSRSTQFSHLDFQRLYALGIDAYRIARELAARRTRFEIDGVTGRLKINLESDVRVERTSMLAEVRNNTLVPFEAPAR